MTDQLPETMSREVVLIGCGKMGSALVGGLISSDMLGADELACNDANPAKANALAERHGARTGEPKTAAERIWIFAVKPKDIASALASYADVLADDDVVISVAAGVQTAMLRDVIGDGPAVVRSMPNTPALVREGVTGIYASDGRGLDVARLVFDAVGEVVELDSESDFDALTAISGSGPAYIFTALEALADGGVSMGLNRGVARQLAAATVRGAASLAIEHPETHTAELKDRVASPGGTTIAGLVALEKHGFRDALISAVQAAAQRSKEMGESDDG